MLAFKLSLIVCAVALSNAQYPSHGQSSGSSYSSVSWGNVGKQAGYENSAVYSAIPAVGYGQVGYQRSGLNLGYNSGNKRVNLGYQNSGVYTGAPAVAYGGYNQGSGSSYSSISLGQSGLNSGYNQYNSGSKRSNVGYQNSAVYSAAPAVAYGGYNQGSGSSYSSINLGLDGYQKSGLSLGYNQVAYAAPKAYASPVASYGYGHGQQQHADYYAHPKYEFSYGVADEHTKDFHNQHEVRDGDVVQGEYSLHEADGTLRTVKYVADKNGFNAHVDRSGHAGHPQTYASGHNQKYNQQNYY